MFKRLKEQTHNNYKKEDVEEKIEIMTIRIETQRKQIEENNDKIAGMELRVEEFEKKILNDKKSKERKIKDLENFLKGKTENAMKDQFKCEYCDFQTPSERGLNVHIKRKHTDMRADKHPKECDFCEFNEKVKVTCDSI